MEDVGANQVNLSNNAAERPGEEVLTEDQVVRVDRCLADGATSIRPILEYLGEMGHGLAAAAARGILIGLVRELSGVHRSHTVPLVTEGGVHGWGVRGCASVDAATELEALVKALEGLHASRLFAQPQSSGGTFDGEGIRPKDLEGRAFRLNDGVVRWVAGLSRRGWLHLLWLRESDGVWFEGGRIKPAEFIPMIDGETRAPGPGDTIKIASPMGYIVETTLEGGDGLYPEVDRKGRAS